MGGHANNLHPIMKFPNVFAMRSLVLKHNIATKVKVYTGKLRELIINTREAAELERKRGGEGGSKGRGGRETISHV